MSVEVKDVAIVTFFMANIDRKSVELQRKVVAMRNPKGYAHYSIQTVYEHGVSMDLTWAKLGIKHPTFGDVVIDKQFDHEVILFLDVDAIPCNADAINTYVEAAANCRLVGNIQRSNHIQNDQHLFAAPSALAISGDMMLSLGMPSARPNYRSDVAEEITFRAEEKGYPVDLYLPLRFDAAPAESPSWALRPGLQHKGQEGSGIYAKPDICYGRGTTFGYKKTKVIDVIPGMAVPATEWEEVETFWHNFQSFHPGQQEVFYKKCETELAKGI